MGAMNSAFGSEPKTSLHQTVEDGGKQETTEELQTFRTDYEERTLLLQAICNINETTLEDDGYVTCVNDLKETLLGTEFLSKTDEEVVEALLHRGVHVNMAAFYETTALHLCVRYNKNVKIVTQLLLNGAQVHAINKDGDSPLHFGAENVVANYWRETSVALLHKTGVDICIQLLEHGSNILISNRRGRTPLGIAMKHVLFAKLLVKYALMHNFVGGTSNALNLKGYRNFRNYSAVASYVAECVSELVKMKTVKVGRFMMHDFFTIKYLNTPLYSEDERAKIFTQVEQLVANCPIYCDIILPRVNCALGRGMLLGKLNEVFVYSRNNYGSKKSFGEKVVLNYDCRSIITKHLSSENLCSLTLAFYNSGSQNLAIGLEKCELEKKFHDSLTITCTNKARLQ